MDRWEERSEAEGMRGRGECDFFFLSSILGTLGCLCKLKLSPIGSKTELLLFWLPSREEMQREREEPRKIASSQSQSRGLKCFAHSVL